MKLECAQGPGANPATLKDIEQVFADDARRGEFAILTSDDGSFVQVAGEGEGPFALEFHDASSDSHLIAKREFAKPEVVELFSAFAQGDQSWRDAIQWQPLAESNGCFTKAAIITICAVLIIQALFS